MVSVVRIDPTGIYDDGALRHELGLAHAAVNRARRTGRLRFTRQGHRVLYLGQWVLDWLQADGQNGKELVRG